MTSKIIINKRVVKKVKYARDAIRKGDNTVKVSMQTNHRFIDTNYTLGVVDMLVSIKNETTNRIFLEVALSVLVSLAEVSPKTAQKLLSDYAEEVGYNEACSLVRSLSPDLHILEPYKTVKKRIKAKK
ncbi:MAG: hypothetical protein IJR47_03455 [Clostridia bacterium]|nr:hypothetical protein [Clostridia bacterium]